MSSQHRTDQHDLPTAAAAVGSTGTGGVPSDHACGCVSRRQSFLVAGTAVAGTAALGACGAAEDAVQGAASSAASAASSAASSAAGDLIKAAEIPVGGGKVFEDLKVVVTQPTAGEYKAFSATCTHQGCSVTSVADNTITCPCHGSTFDAATGAVKQGPATRPLEAKTINVGADGITVT